MAVPTAELTTVGHVPFYVPATRLPISLGPQSVLFETNQTITFDETLRPITLVILSDNASLSSDILSAVVDEYLQRDDVLSPAFLQHLLLLTTSKWEWTERPPKPIINLLEKWQTQSVHMIQQNSSLTPSALRAGPYFATRDSL
jgi:hypothetical protein